MSEARNKNLFKEKKPLEVAKSIVDEIDPTYRQEDPIDDAIWSEPIPIKDVNR